MYSWKSLNSRKYYENTPIQIYRKFHLQKLNFLDKKLLYFFKFSAQNIHCGYLLEPPHRRSNGYPQSMFCSRKKEKILYDPAHPIFFCIKVGFEGGQNYIDMFS